MKTHKSRIKDESKRHIQITLTIESSVLKHAESLIDGKYIRNRSEAVETILRDKLVTIK